MAGGSTANRTGARAEMLIAAMFEAAGCIVQRQQPAGEQGIKGLFGEDIVADLLVERFPGCPAGLFVEVKYQAVSGSADQKLAYTALNIRARYNLPTWIVLAGPHSRSKEQIRAVLEGLKGGALERVLYVDELLHELVQAEPTDLDDDGEQ